MGSIEAFVAFDVAKLKHAMAVAEGGRDGEVRFLGEIENEPASRMQSCESAPQSMQARTSGGGLIGWPRGVRAKG